jgi:hypothetical protein
VHDELLFFPFLIIMVSGGVTNALSTRFPERFSYFARENLAEFCISLLIYTKYEIG